MIFLLRGEIVRKEVGSVVIDVGGVGYGVVIPLSTYDAIGDAGSRVELAIHTSCRENAVELFGFLTDSEKEMFEKLIGVPGIGPRAAVKVLSSVSVTDLADSIMNGDLAKRKIRGLGPKTAAKITSELGGKVASLASGSAASAGKSTLEEVISALLNLGYTRAEVERNVSDIREAVSSASSLEDAIKDSLRIMRSV